MLMGYTVGTWILILIMASFSISALIIWYAAKGAGQFDDIESVKHRMLDEDGPLDVPLSEINKAHR